MNKIKVIILLIFSLNSAFGQTFDDCLFFQMNNQDEEFYTLNLRICSCISPQSKVEIDILKVVLPYTNSEKLIPFFKNHPEIKFIDASFSGIETTFFEELSSFLQNIREINIAATKIRKIEDLYFLKSYPKLETVIIDQLTINEIGLDKLSMYSNINFVQSEVSFPSEYMRKVEMLKYFNNLENPLYLRGNLHMNLYVNNKGFIDRVEPIGFLSKRKLGMIEKEFIKNWLMFDIQTPVDSLCIEWNVSL